LRNDSLPNAKTHYKYGVKSRIKRHPELEKACESWGYVDCFIHRRGGNEGLCNSGLTYNAAHGFAAK
jgi:hypothetical protein